MCVHTPLEAQRIVVRYLNLHVKAEQGLGVSPPLRAAELIEGFAETGDPIWEVRRTDIHDNFTIDGLFWVNGRTGGVLELFPSHIDRVVGD